MGAVWDSSIKLTLTQKLLFLCKNQGENLKKKTQRVFIDDKSSVIHCSPKIQATQGTF